MVDRQTTTVCDCRTTVVAQHEQLTLDPTNDTDYYGSPSPFGMDPVSVDVSCMRAVLKQEAKLSLG